MNNGYILQDQCVSQIRKFKINKYNCRCEASRGKPHVQKMSEGHSARGSLHMYKWVANAQCHFESKYCIWRPVETGRKIQYSAPLRRVAKDQDCSAPYVGEDLLSIRGPFQKQIQYSALLRRVAKYSIAPSWGGSQKIKTARLHMLVRISPSIRGP